MVLPSHPAKGVLGDRHGPRALAIKSVADDLGVNTETLRNWIRASDGRRSAPQPAAAQAGGADVQAELAAARKRIRELEEERDILRKAARYFAGETRW
ncbi:transposase [Streptomyces erythrochromogenes]|uniref:transposase n=1 Tax=Streptomyces erythrochromogenes TaxID=285574 RepID=UPI00369880E7